LIHLDDLRSLAVFIKKHRKRNCLVLNECHRVASATGAQRGYARPGSKNLIVPFTDLTGPFPARQSAKVAEKQEYVSFFSPKITKSVGRTLRIGERNLCEFWNRVHRPKRIASPARHAARNGRIASSKRAR
jgi:hypothetical protein